MGALLSGYQLMNGRFSVNLSPMSANPQRPAYKTNVAPTQDLLKPFKNISFITYPGGQVFGRAFTSWEEKPLEDVVNRIKANVSKSEYSTQNMEATENKKTLYKTLDDVINKRNELDPMFSSSFTYRPTKTVQTNNSQGNNFYELEATTDNLKLSREYTIRGVPEKDRLKYEEFRKKYPSILRPEAILYGDQTKTLKADLEGNVLDYRVAFGFEDPNKVENLRNRLDILAKALSLGKKNVSYNLLDGLSNEKQNRSVSDFERASAENNLEASKLGVQAFTYY